MIVVLIAARKQFVIPLFGLVDAVLRDVCLAEGTIYLVVQPLVHAWLVVAVSHVAGKNHDLAWCWLEEQL